MKVIRSGKAAELYRWGDTWAIELMPKLPREMVEDVGGKVGVRCEVSKEWTGRHWKVLRTFAVSEGLSRWPLKWERKSFMCAITVL